MLIKELLKNNYKKDIDENANANANANAKAKKASQQAFINTLLAERQVLNNKKN